MSLKDLDKAKTTVSLTKANNLNYTLPTALNIKMPRTLSELRKVEKSVSRSELNWENPAAEDNSREMNFAKMKLEYHVGTYFVNGNEQNISDTDEIADLISNIQHSIETKTSPFKGNKLLK